MLNFISICFAFCSLFSIFSSYLISKFILRGIQPDFTSNSRLLLKVTIHNISTQRTFVKYFVKSINIYEINFHTYISMLHTHTQITFISEKKKIIKNFKTNEVNTF